MPTVLNASDTRPTEKLTRLTAPADALSAKKRRAREAGIRGESSNGFGRGTNRGRYQGYADGETVQ